MRVLLLNCFLFFALSASLFGQTKNEVKISGRFEDTSFIQFSKEVERNYNVRFYFKDDWIKSLTINVIADSIPVSKLMDKILLSTTLDYVVLPPSTVIILPDKRFVHDLPEYRYSSDSVSLLKDKENETQKKYLTGRQKEQTETIIIGSRNKTKQGKPALIRGLITDSETDEPLIGATIMVPELRKGAATNAEGILTLSLMPGIYSVVFQYLGMVEIKSILDVRSDGSFTVKMKKLTHSIQEILVQGNDGIKRGAKLGMEIVSAKAMKEIPTLMGEKDVIKVAQMLPGIVSVGEGSAGVNVRGGNADQNLFYINKVPVYNTSHLFGFFTSINSEIVDNFSVYKGQIPSEFGGRLSSVFDVQTRLGSKKKFFTQGGVSPISANAEIEVPLVKEKMSLMLSGRSTYSDWILKRLNDPDLRSSKASFSDFAGSLDYKLNENNQLTVFGYQSSDHFDLNGYTQYNYGNFGGSLDYQHKFSTRVKAELALVSSSYNYKTVEKKIANEAYSHNYSLNHFEFKGNLGWIPSDKHTIKLGADLILYQLDRGEMTPFGKESLRIPVLLGKEKGLESAFYLDDNIVLGPKLNFYAGLRYSTFTALGPETVRSYYPNMEMIENNVSGTTAFKSGEKIVTYSNPEFRSSIDYKISRASSVKLSVNQMTQYLFMLSNTISIAPNDQWKLVSPTIKPPKSTLYSAGYFYSLQNMGITASGEIYYKQARDIVEYKDGADFLSTPYVETTILQGKQKAYGAEFMLSKDVGRLNGWVSYTYSRSLITVNGEKDWADINLGKEYPSNFDKPHVLNIVLNLKLNRRFSFSSNMIYNSGRPITIPKSSFYIDGQPFVEYSARNAYRVPDYFRWDVSFKLEGNLKKKKLVHSYWMLSAYNVTGRKNANSIFFISEEGQLHGYKYSVVGVPIITLSWNWKLGNYANQ